MNRKQQEQHATGKALVLACLGIVYGDIGTSPLYAMNESFFGHVGIARTPENVLGVCSLFFWSLILVVTLKYVVLITRADHKGEGGIFALLGLLRSYALDKRVLTAAIVIGAALLYADGIITPAISVLSAYEGLEVVKPSFEMYVIPLTILTLFALFAFQRRGTAGVGQIFGPVMVVWFVVLAVMGIPQIVQHYEVLKALSPTYAYTFIQADHGRALVVLGAVVLCITGGEALYADMGHFGRKAIATGWLRYVLPALVLNYFGQGARLLSPDVVPNDNLFFALVPHMLTIPMVILATMATIIASQALISGAYSLTQQAIALEYFPRMAIKHTSAEVAGQIYMPFVNWLLFGGCTALVITFGSSSALAAAYGIAVTGTMAITTVSFMVVARPQLGWRLRWILPGMSALLCIDVLFFSANALKFWNGGYVPVLVATGLSVVMFTWKWGRGLTHAAYNSIRRITVSDLLLLKKDPQSGRMPVPVIVLSSQAVRTIRDQIPHPVFVQWHRFKSIAQRYVFMTFVFEDVSVVNNEERYTLLPLSLDQNDTDQSAPVLSVIVRIGFMEQPSVHEVLRELNTRELISLQQLQYLLTIMVGKDSIQITGSLLWQLRVRLYRLIDLVAAPAYALFGLDIGDEKLGIETIPINLSERRVSVPPAQTAADPVPETAQQEVAA